MAETKEYNVQINFVPFIDLLSSVTVFLLLTAVWNEYAQIDVEPQGLGRDAEEVLDEEEDPITASILVTEDSIWAGLSTGVEREVPMSGDGRYDWEGLEETLSEFLEMEAFDERNDIEVAAEDFVAYQSIISTMDTAIRSGFDDIGFVDPPSLTVPFHE